MDAPHATPVSRRPRAPNGKPRLAASKAPHAAHIHRHLARLREGLLDVAEPEAVFLGHDEGSFFWELVGFRLEGNPFPILAAVRFRKQELPGNPNARESLATYLSDPPPPPANDPDPPPSGSVSVLLPRSHDTIPDFLAQLRAGRTPVPVHLSPKTVRVAFDFRMHNPAGFEAAKRNAPPLARRMFRTAAGHLLEGHSHGPGDGPCGRGFLAVKDPVQHVQEGRARLPSLVLNPGFVTLSVDLSGETTRLAASSWAPFSPKTASRRHVLLG